MITSNDKYESARIELVQRLGTQFSRYKIDPEAEVPSYNIRSLSFILYMQYPQADDFGEAAALLSAALGDPFWLHPPAEFSFFRLVAQTILSTGQEISVVENTESVGDDHARWVFLRKNQRGIVRELCRIEHNKQRFATERSGKVQNYLHSKLWCAPQYATSTAVQNVAWLRYQALMMAGKDIAMAALTEYLFVGVDWHEELFDSTALVLTEL